jgi:hypothetical protein
LAEQSELKTSNQRLQEELVQRDRRLEQHEKTQRELSAELAYVKRQLEALKRKLFGQSRGEHVSEAQLQLAHLPKTAMASAISYCRSQWPKLTTYVDHGQTRIDNNLTEQAIRPTKIGAKNWLFIGHPDAGQRAAIIYTILECCRRHQVEPLAYLNDLLRRLPGMTNHEVAAAKLTPRDWKPAA